MKREGYLIELAGHLKKLPKKDYDDTMGYFTELFDEAGPEGEQDLMASLGEPKEAAADAMGVLLDKKMDEAKTHKEKIGVVWFALLAIAAAPLGLLFLGFLLLLLLFVILGFVAALLGLFGVSMIMTVLSLIFLWESIVHFQTVGILLFNLGGFMISLGLGLLLLIGGVGVSKLMGRGIVRLAQYLYRKVKKNGKMAEKSRNFCGRQYSCWSFDNSSWRYGRGSRGRQPYLPSTRERTRGHHKRV